MPDNKMNPRGEHRRQWLTTVCRWAALTVLAVLTGRLVLRPGRADGCDRRLVCQRCGQWQDCVLPKANQARREHGRNA